MPENIHTALAEHQLARRALLERYPDLAEDDPALLDTLDGISSLREACLAVMASADDDEMLLAGINQRMAALHERAARLEHRVERKHDIVRNAMELGGMRKIEGPELTLAIAKSARAVVITDTKQIPDNLMMPMPAKPNLREIKEALLAGTHVPGAVLNNPADHLVIRRR